MTSLLTIYIILPAYVSHSKSRIMLHFQPRGENNEVFKLKDYNVQPNSTIYLLVLLYAIPDGFDHVIFDLVWGYPTFDVDFLDASVLLYSHSEFIEVVDWKNKTSRSCSAVKHSGDDMKNDKRLGHQTIDVWIKSIPAYINKLVFTLSAWKSRNIFEYPNRCLRFFDAKNRDKQLCDDKMSDDKKSHATDFQAVIMCCLTNKGSGWEVFSLQNPSHGNAKNYEPLKNSIVGLIGKGYI